MSTEPSITAAVRGIKWKEEKKREAVIIDGS